jgi:VWFA-related protein
MFGMRNMIKISRGCVLGILLLGSCLASHAQVPQLRPRSAAKSSDENKRVQLDVQVTDVLGRPVSGLKPEDFSVFDNLAPVKPVTFSAGAESGNPVEIIFVFDLLSSSFEDVARARQQLSAFLRSNGGQLSHPVTIVWLQKTGPKGKDGTAQNVIPIQKGAAYLHVILASTDGNALAKQLDASDMAVSGSLAAQGVSSGAVQLSLQALEILASGSADRPSRKMLIWLSPGWPLLSQPNGKMREQLFNFVVYLYGELRRARVTLYSVDPTGLATAFNSDGPIVRSSNPLLQQMIDANHNSIGKFDPAMASYSAYLKSPTNVKETQPNAVSLQVMAVQSGGLVLEQGNDIGVEIARCVGDADSFYTLSYDMPAAKQANEFHATQVTVGRHAMSVRTRTGYYAQPTGAH